MFGKPRMRACRLAVSLTLPFALSACLTTRPTLNGQNSPCMKILLASGLLDPTPGADKGLIDGSAGGLGAYAVGEAGQRVKANIDKATAKRIGSTCDAEWSAALKAAQPRKRFLGVF